MKNSYILLRNNKESGPHSFAELESLGLKPDDLIWVEGQSVTWLNPVFIRELKILTTPVTVPEKQLAEIHHENDNGIQSINESFSGNETNNGIVHDNNNGNGNGNGNGYSNGTSLNTNGTVPKKKSVFVSLPAGNAALEKKYAPQPETETEVISKNYAATPIAEVETKYSQPLDEIKDMYVKTLQDRKRKIAYQKNLVKFLKIAAVFVGLIGIGAYAGITFYKAGNKKAGITEKRTDNPAGNQTGANTSLQSVLPVVADSVSSDSLYLLENTTTIDPLFTDEKLVKEQANKNKKANDTDAKKGSTMEPVSLPVNMNAINSDERNSKTRNEVAEIKTVPLESITPLVSVKSNNYKIGAFGGIKDLQLTVVNDSKYILDYVVVEVEYLKPSEETLKTEKIYFKSVPPNGTQTMTIDKSNRGVKVNYKIIKIEPKLTGNVAGI